MREINEAAVGCARRAVDAWNVRTPDKPRFVAGSIGPTGRTTSISPKVEDPGYRAVTFDQMAESYYQQVEVLVEGGVDILFPETTFDTLNLKACLFAIEQFFDEHQLRLPVMASVTITDASGRTLSGQTIEAFWNSVSHFDLLSVGINCALGPDKMRPYVEELSRIAPVFVSCHPNAGLPNAFGRYEETPEEMARVLGEFVANGWLNIVGGCCGTTPAHIRAFARIGATGKPPRRRPQVEPYFAAQRPGGPDRASGQQLSHDRRADQRHGLAEVRPADPRGAVRRGVADRPRAGGGGRGDHRRQHGRRAAGRRSRDDAGS